MTTPITHIASIAKFEEKVDSLPNKTWTNIYILVDENTKIDCLPIVFDQIPFLKVANILVLDPGEENKTLEIAEQLWNSLVGTGADRKSLLINLGGGVITDLGGFVASTFKRGIDFIHIPTTLLGQVDAAIGGKTGVNLEFSKNQVGTFALPLFTFVDSQFLRTLPKREFISGMAEVIKYGLTLDENLFDLLKMKENLISNLDKIIQTSVRIKSKIITEDFEEEGERKKLNFGHTVGHAIETYYLGEILHGEAVGIGMVCESYISYKEELISETVLNEIKEMIFSFFDKVTIEEKFIDSLLLEMKSDKKNVEGKLNFTLLNGIGKSSIDHYIEEDLVKESLLYYRNV